ncbi:MAG: hypothetical protein IJM62_07350 [Lachnospiraceae bacterium]|nr:hypothetical protein [Lachnospiraceae bacterium]
MKWYSRLYTSGSVTGVEKIIMRELERKEDTEGYYLITLPSNGIGLLEIMASEKSGAGKHGKKELFVVGLAGTKEEAQELAGQIVADVYAKTGAFDTASFFGGE